jgi:uncharacterized membrane protein
VNLLLQFVYLQILDVLSTLAFLRHGLEEANPLVRLAISGAHSPLGGLLALKLLGAGLAFYCWRQGRLRVLVRANVFFAVLVAWNLVALLVARSAAV